jgi:hypothetical protein
MSFACMACDKAMNTFCNVSELLKFSRRGGGSEGPAPGHWALHSRERCGHGMAQFRVSFNSLRRLQQTKRRRRSLFVRQGALVARHLDCFATTYINFSDTMRAVAQVLPPCGDARPHHPAPPQPSGCAALRPSPWLPAELCKRRSRAAPRRSRRVRERAATVGPPGQCCRCRSTANSQHHRLGLPVASVERRNLIVAPPPGVPAAGSTR